MNYDDRLYDETDPLYAPGLVWSRPTAARWRPTKRYLDAGFPTKSVPLPGHRGDGRDAERALICRDQTRAMLRWWDAQDVPDHKPGTWGELLARYRLDDFSPIHNVKANTRAGYLEQVAKLDRALGHLQIADLTYEEAMGMKRAMENKGRSVSYVTRLFKQLRAVAGYGRTLRIPSARDAVETLAGIKLTTPPTSTSYPTRDEVMAVVKEADRKGMHAFACGYLMCFELSLRAVDIRGQWLPSKNTSGIHRKGMSWQDGLTWDMIAPDLSSMTKVISKTAKSMPEAYVFDLTLLPEVQARLRKLRERRAIGPVIIAENTDLPYTTQSWSRAFYRIRNHLGLREELTVMSARAGGLTEARSLVHDPLLLRDAGQHKQMSTTNGYLRGRSEGANQVIELRSIKR
jgi:hypothetical protein